MTKSNVIARVNPYIVYFVAAIFSYIAARIASVYLKLTPVDTLGSAVFLCLLFAALFYSCHTLRVGKHITRSQGIALLIVSLLFSLFIILGYHVTVTGEFYFGLAGENFITPYSLIDFGIYLFLVAGSYLLLRTFFLFVTSKTVFTAAKNKHPVLRPVSKKHLFIFSGILFVLWLPYLLVYWPGFVFGDTFNSLYQALDLTKWTNHHPVMYSLFIKGCLSLANVLGLSNTTGCAISTVIQMACMACGIGYMAAWIFARCKVKLIWVVALTSAFGLVPYFATYSIAMWKDPLFSLALMLLSLWITDLILSKGAAAKKRSWLPLFILFALVAAFFRGNGPYILIGTGAVLFFYSLARHEALYTRTLRVSGCTLVAVAIFSMVITGPVYSALKIEPSEKAESYGIMLNQMARVVALEGDMTDSDKAYMAEIFPLDRYASTYRPCCTDMLKLDGEFNGEALENDFFKHWLSMFIQNPRCYFESWELQTFGFWSVSGIDTDPLSMYYWTNIVGGVPASTTSANESYQSMLDLVDITPKNQLVDPSWAHVFPMDSWGIPLSIVNWALLILLVFLFLLRRRSLAIPLVPSLLLAATLIIASPIAYWHRYGFAEQLLLPLFVTIMLIALGRGRPNTPRPTKRIRRAANKKKASKANEV